MVRVILVCVVAGTFTTACGTAASPTATETGSLKGCLVGASFYNLADGDTSDVVDPTLAQAINAAGVGYEARSAKSVSETQVEDIDGLVAAGARVLIIASSYDGAYLPAVQRAIKAGVPVLAIRQPIAAKSLYVGFDPVEEGRQEAKALLAVKPKGRYAIITGSIPPPESDPFQAGLWEILQPAVDRGDITIAGTVRLGPDGFLPEQELTTVLTQNGGVDAVVAASDQLAYEAKTVLEDAGLTGKVAVGGVDYYGQGSGLIDIARGRQAVDVWGNDELVARATAQAAIALCRDPDITRVAGSATVTWPGHDPMTAILLKPVTITKDNLGMLIETDTYWRNLMCTDLGLASELPACQMGPVPLTDQRSRSKTSPGSARTTGSRFGEVPQRALEAPRAARPASG
jgi:D-xylose transport system substrate-binding protein